MDIIEKEFRRMFKEAKYKKNDKVKLSPDALSNYGQKYKNKIFIISNVATSTKQHPGYDNSMQGQGLYDLKGFDNSLYDYELIPA